MCARLTLSAAEDDRELVAAEAERAEAVALRRQEAGDLDEHLVAERMTVGVVDLLEVVDVDEAEADELSTLERRVQRRGETELVGTVVADQREAVGVRVACRATGCERRALVERDREERSGHEHEEARIGRPERCSKRGEERLDRERRPDEADLLLEQREHRHPLVERDRECDEREVDADERRAAEQRVDGDCDRVARSRDPRRNTGSAAAKAESAYTAVLNAVRSSGFRSTTCAMNALTVAMSTASSQPKRMTEARMKTNASETVLRSSSSRGTGFSSASSASAEEEQYGEAFCPGWRIERETHRRPDHDRSRERKCARDQDAQPGRIAGRSPARAYRAPQWPGLG